MRHAIPPLGRVVAERHPDLAKPLNQIAARIVDLLPVVKNHYYHRDMLGSFSIKDVLPTLVPELDYGSLGEVRDGGGAQEAYLEAIDPETTAERRSALRKDLIEYCRRDTQRATVPR